MSGRRITSGARIVVPRPRFSHLQRLSDDTGVFEHADGAVPRLEHGYCVDDVTRALIVVLREPDPPAALGELALRYFAFLRYAVAADGRVHNRLGHDRTWVDEPALDDHWGRALWAFGTAAAAEPTLSRPSLAEPATELFASLARHRSPWPRTMAPAALGAATFLAAHPGHEPATALLHDAGVLLTSSEGPGEWPHGRLTYANAMLPEALIAAGAALGNDDWIHTGTAQLAWLIELQTVAGHLSVTPVGGWEPDEPQPGFDQQPIEAAVLADACARAHDVTGDPRWIDGVALATGWFLADNDVGVALLDPVTGGGCDGLTPTGCNTNQGAESTIALISTLQHAQRLLPPS